MVGVSAGPSTVESSSAAILMPSAAERFITTPRLCTETIEDFLPRMAHSEGAHLRVGMRTGLAQPQVVDMRAHLEATRGRPAASPAAIAGHGAAAAGSRTDTLRMEASSVRPVAGALPADTAAGAKRPIVIPVPA